MVRRRSTSSSWIRETYCEPCSALEETQALLIVDCPRATSDVSRLLGLGFEVDFSVRNLCQYFATLVRLLLVLIVLGSVIQLPLVLSLAFRKSADLFMHTFLKLHYWTLTLEVFQTSTLITGVQQEGRPEIGVLLSSILLILLKHLHLSLSYQMTSYILSHRRSDGQQDLLGLLIPLPDRC
ncbi:hypothetical protein Tco_0434577 [Tanacetum coccineum]